jgi:hypothetical protein
MPATIGQPGELGNFAGRPLPWELACNIEIALATTQGAVFEKP